MKEFIFVEFLFETHNIAKGDALLQELCDDFVPINSGLSWGEMDKRGYSKYYYSVRGSIRSETATAIKLSNKFLSDRMLISEKLKDKYRNG